jgi:calcineurin-like phosphoesterase family protein
MMFILTPDTWLISDTHWGHGKIVQYENRPERHNEIMLDNWHARVKPNDTVLHLGDICMTVARLADLYRQIRELPGHKFLLKGNHDTNSHKWYLDKVGFHTLQAYKRPSRSKNGMQGDILRYETIGGTRVAFSHAPSFKDTDWDINIHGHIHSNGYPTPLYESGKDYRNICVEVTGYRPIQLWDALSDHTCYRTPKQAGIYNGDTRLAI